MALQLAIAATTLWDFRLYDLRVFDGIALGCLAVFVILSPESRAGFAQRRRDYWLLFAIVVFYAAFGYLLHAHRSSLAILILAGIGFILAGRRDWLPSQGILLGWCRPECGWNSVWRSLR